MAPHSRTLAWKIPWTEEPGGLQPMGWLRVRHDWVTSLSCIGGGNGNSLQCSCLENPRDGGAWWAAVYGAAQSWTRLQWLSSSSPQRRDDSCEVDAWVSGGIRVGLRPLTFSFVPSPLPYMHTRTHEGYTHRNPSVQSLHLWLSLL